MGRDMASGLVRAQYLREYKIRVLFDDGLDGVIDLAGELWGEVFESLRNTDVFQRFRVDTELDTIVWPTGADLAPEFIRVQAGRIPWAGRDDG